MNKTSLSIALMSLLALQGGLVGGKRVDIKDHPWQVAFHIERNGKMFLCGGSIIAEKWVLSAAHCFAPNTRPGDVRVKSGASNYVASGTWVEVERVLIHESYDPSTHAHDIALIKLKSPHDGEPIPLAPAMMSVDVGERLQVTGWGATSEGGQPQPDLLRATVLYVENAVCNQPASYNGAIMPDMMCAGYDVGTVDACQGDSGGPLVWQSPNGPVLVGVVSFGEGCARELKYGVYTRVAGYISWVNSTMAAELN